MVDWVPILLMLIIAVGFALVSLGVSYLLSPKNPTPEKLAPYECGIFPEEEPSQRFPVKFYMVAMLYIVFDIEIIFLLAWATRFNELGWYGILVIQFLVFLCLRHFITYGKKVFLTGIRQEEKDTSKKHYLNQNLNQRRSHNVLTR